MNHGLKHRIGKPLQDTNIRESTEVLVIAIRDRKASYIYNPGPETILTENVTLVVLGSADSVIKLREAVSSTTNGTDLINPQ